MCVFVCVCVLSQRVQNNPLNDCFDRKKVVFVFLFLQLRSGVEGIGGHTRSLRKKLQREITDSSPSDSQPSLNGMNHGTSAWVTAA